MPLPAVTAMESLRRIAEEGDTVRLAVAAAGRRAEIDDQLEKVRAGQVGEDDIVGAGQGVVADRLDVVEVHGDGGDVAEEADAPAVGRRCRYSRWHSSR